MSAAIPTEPKVLIPLRDMGAELARLTRENADLERRLEASRDEAASQARCLRAQVRELEEQVARVSDRSIEQQAPLHEEITALRRERQQMRNRVDDLTRERDHYRTAYESRRAIGRAGAEAEIGQLRMAVEHFEVKCREYRGVICDLLAEHGTDCDECSGSGLVMEEELGRPAGGGEGHTTRRVEVPCTACFDGRVER